MESKYYTTKDVCDILGISRTGLWRAVKRGDIPKPMLLGNRNRFPKELIDNLYEERIKK